VGQRLRHRLRRGPRWRLVAFVVAAIVLIAGFIALSFAADRADAINRLVELEGGEDMRSRALPTVLSMIGTYMPFGSGFGGFDSIFRIHEPFALLKPSYFNQAHNDYLGIALDGGIAALAVLAACIVWWIVATIRIRRSKGDNVALTGKLGSAIILLILVASVTDYPARTPTVMAFLVIAGVWLARADAHPSQTALPS
jgi:O-antigen ligase